MNKRFGNPLQSDFVKRNEMYSKANLGGQNLFTKMYPAFFKREDVHGDFVSVQRELRNQLPDAKIIKEDIDTNFVRIQFDVPTSQEVMLEKILAKRGFVRNSK